MLGSSNRGRLGGQLLQQGPSGPLGQARAAWLLPAADAALTLEDLAAIEWLAGWALRSCTTADRRSMTLGRMVMECIAMEGRNACTRNGEWLHGVGPCQHFCPWSPQQPHAPI